MLCGLCGEETPRVVPCAGNNCAASVGGCCLSVDGLCCECAAEANRKRARDYRQVAMWLKQLAVDLSRGWTSESIAQGADDLVDRWRREVREEQR